jgi:peptidoglycan/xylan/chitin deacetylase (PgdA/CDA1 family)
VANDVATLEALTRKLLSAVRKYSSPAVGFINEGQLFVDAPASADRRTGLLRMWLDAGIELGNHTYSHRDLNTIPLEQFQADVLRGEAVTRRLLEQKGQRLDRISPTRPSAEMVPVRASCARRLMQRTDLPRSEIRSRDHQHTSN